jgi:acetyl CoA:N6-hydroxylysine acetyl transferase
MNQRLFCKPAEGTAPAEILYKTYLSSLHAWVSLRSLDLDLDLAMICDWMNRDYSRRFWQMTGSKCQIENTYSDILNNPACHSFIGLLNEKPVCLVDIYLLSADELSAHVAPDTHDAGMHFHMAPVTRPVHGLSLFMMRSCLNYYFNFPEAERMYGEPDAENIKANRLVQTAGFEFIKPVTMSSKRANLWVYTRKHFLNLSNAIE